MKKRLLLLLTGMVLAVIVAGCSSGETDKDVDTESEGDPVTYVAPGVILDKIDKEETFAFILGDADCGACQSYLETTLKEIQEKSDVTLEYIELKGIEAKEDEFADVQVLIEEHLDGQFEATPSTYFIVDGELKDVSVGVVTYDELLETYEKYIK